MEATPTETTLLVGSVQEKAGKCATEGFAQSKSLPRVVSYQDVVKQRPSTTVAVVVTVLLGVTNNVLLKIMYSAYGVKYAYPASQLINLLYVVLGGIPLVFCLYCTDQISPEERKISKTKFFYMGILDSLGVCVKYIYM